MPSYMLRDIPAQLWAYIVHTSQELDQPLRATLLELLERGRRWDAVRAGRVGGQRRAAQTTAEQRRAWARLGAVTRWAKRGNTED